MPSGPHSPTITPGTLLALRACSIAASSRPAVPASISLMLAVLDAVGVAVAGSCVGDIVAHPDEQMTSIATVNARIPGRVSAVAIDRAVIA